MPKLKQFDWYENALFYDIVFDADTPQDADGIAALHERYGRTRGKRMLEPACGSGRLVAEMTARGYGVTGLDISDGMLRFARQRLRERAMKARLVKKGMEDFAFRERFDIAHCLVNSFKHLLDPAAARAHLQCVAQVLKPGGIYLLGLHLTQYADRAKGWEKWTGTRDGVEVECVIYGWPAVRRQRTERVRSRMLVRDNGGEERRMETNWLFRTYSERQVKALLRSVPELEHVATHDFDMKPDDPIRLGAERLDNVLVLRRAQ